MPRCVKCARVMPTSEVTRAQRPKGEWTCKDVGVCAAQKTRLELGPRYPLRDMEKVGHMAEFAGSHARLRTTGTTPAHPTRDTPA